MVTLTYVNSVQSSASVARFYQQTAPKSTYVRNGTTSTVRLTVASRHVLQVTTQIVQPVTANNVWEDVHYVNKVI